MALKLSANLNFLFTEGVSSIEQRMRLAHCAGFQAVEIPFTNPESDNIIKAQKDTGIEVSLINIALGPDDLKLGAASIPGAEETFKAHLQKTVELAKALCCEKIHIMAGIKKGDYDEQFKTYSSNLKYAASYLEKENIVGVIEPINKYSVPIYFMNSYEIASSLIREINSKHLQLLVDIFHLQHIRGNVSNTFKEMGDILGHIQIAQVPHRHEPDSPGELDFSYIFDLIKEHGYTDFIGCEYKPKTTTADGLKWRSKYGLDKCIG